jgi:hypothetical protein
MIEHASNTSRGTNWGKEEGEGGNICEVKSVPPFRSLPIPQSKPSRRGVIHILASMFIIKSFCTGV